MGETKVPLNPQRVIVLDNAILDSAIALGVKPVAGTFYEDIPSYIQTKSQGIENVGLESQPNLEKMLLLKPDLILGDRLSNAEIYDKLSKIAPTVLAQGSGWQGEWKANFRVFAAALGKNEAADRLLQQYDRRLTEFKQKMGDRLDRNVSILVSKPEEVVIYTNSSFPGSVLQDAGLRRPPVQNQSNPLLQVSLETIPDIEGDSIFLVKNSKVKDSDALLKRFMAHPLWSKLKPVQQDKVYSVNSEVWIAGRSFLAANALIDDLYKYLLP
jgi:iron complex transport system substrate-binding protein